jgi:hypothetical protein
MAIKEITIGAFNRQLLIEFGVKPAPRDYRLNRSDYPRIEDNNFFSESSQYAVAKCMEYHGFDSLIRRDDVIYFTNGDALVTYRLHAR